MVVSQTEGRRMSDSVCTMLHLREFVSSLVLLPHLPVSSLLFLQHEEIMSDISPNSRTRPSGTLCIMPTEILPAIFPRYQMSEAIFLSQIGLADASQTNLHQC